VIVKVLTIDDAQKRSSGKRKREICEQPGSGVSTTIKRDSVMHLGI
jgi:hypothetical protein